MKFFLFLTEGAGDAVGSGDMLSFILTSVLPLVAIVVLFYFMLIRPESKRKKATAKMRNELAVGDEVTTIGGIIGKVVNIKDDEITVESGADKVRVKFMRWAISARGNQATEQA